MTLDELIVELTEVRDKYAGAGAAPAKIKWDATYGTDVSRVVVLVTPRSDVVETRIEWATDPSGAK